MRTDQTRGATSPTGAATVSAALVAAGVALLATAPSPAGSLRTLRGLTTALDPLDPAAPVLAVVGLAAWALAAYLALGVGLLLLGRAPGLLGTLAAAVARRTVPVALRRTVETVLGAGLVLGALGAVPAAAEAPQAVVAAASASTASLDWPVTATVAPTVAPTGTPATTPPGPAPETSPPATPGATHVVRPGDTLWDLAAQALRTPDGPAPADAAVAAAWPSWWEANRDAIGDDPHLLHPGTALVAPPSAP